ncbi:MAG: hypothetical protein PF692_15635 [Kiritimatiellae bacterium]|jgi:hypothetical protein|nr:hypothetical protein [Kiritimatiellia bacterium]
MKVKLMVAINLIALITCFAKENVFSIVEDDLNSTNKWNNPKTIQLLRTNVSNANLTSNDLRKVKITLATYLICQDTTNMNKQKVQEPFKICDDILKNDQKSWEAQIAKFYKVLQYGNTGEHLTQIKLAQEARKNIDFVLVEKQQDSVCKGIVKLYTPYEGTTLKETLIMIEASAWCYIDRPDQAEIILKQINHPQYKSLLKDFIILTKKNMKSSINIENEN